MKKLAFLAVGAAALALSACGGNNEADTLNAEDAQNMEAEALRTPPTPTKRTLSTTVRPARRKSRTTFRACKEPSEMLRKAVVRMRGGLFL